MLILGIVKFKTLTFTVVFRHDTNGITEKSVVEYKDIQKTACIDTRKIG